MAMDKVFLHIFSKDLINKLFFVYIDCTLTATRIQNNILEFRYVVIVLSRIRVLREYEEINGWKAFQ